MTLLFLHSVVDACLLTCLKLSPRTSLPALARAELMLVCMAVVVDALAASSTAGSSQHVKGMPEPGAECAPPGCEMQGQQHVGVSVGKVGGFCTGRVGATWQPCQGLL